MYNCGDLEWRNSDNSFLAQEDGNYIEGYNEVIEKRVKIEKTLCRQILTGKTINRYSISDERIFIIYTYELKNLKTQLIPEDKLKAFFPQCYKFLLDMKDRLTTRGSKSMKYPCWYSLWNFRNISNQTVTKILTPDVCFGSSMCLDTGSYFYNDTSYALILKCGDLEHYKAYLSILNSSITWFFLQNTGSELRGGYFRFKTKYLEPFPLPDICDDKFSTLKTELANFADQMLSLNMELQETSQKFQRIMQRKFELAELPGKLQEWYQLSYADFIKELGKKKIKLSLAQEAEWEEYFVQEAKRAQELKATIDATDKAIDQMVYKLYGLTQDEIKIVEGK